MPDLVTGFALVAIVRSSPPKFSTIYTSPSKMTMKS
jgi:hypothetical protein